MVEPPEWGPHNPKPYVPEIHDVLAEEREHLRRRMFNTHVENDDFEYDEPIEDVEPPPVRLV